MRAFKTEVPIYQARLYLIIAKDIYRERSKPRYVELFGECPDAGGDAFCSWAHEGGSFALFFAPESLTHRIVAHEIFHLTRRIMEWTGVNFDHESGALLTGYLHNFVYFKVGKLIKQEKKFTV